MMNRPSLASATWALLVGALLLASCTGNLGEPPGEQGDPGAQTLPASGATVLRHLNRVELGNTYHDVLGDAYQGDPAAVQQRMSPDTRVQGFDTIAEAITTSDGYVEQVQALGEYMATQTDVVALSACDAAAKGEGPCVDEFLAQIGTRVLRRPLGPDERASYKALFDLARSTEEYPVALRAVLTRLFSAPDFLYPIALGDLDTGKLVDFELATRLGQQNRITAPAERRGPSTS